MTAGFDLKNPSSNMTASEVLLSLRELLREQVGQPELESVLKNVPESLRDKVKAIGAVLIPLVVRNEALEVLYTKRSRRLTHHRGEIAFPGGKHDLTDENLLVTALREAKEEIGLDPDTVEILGYLPIFEVSRSGVAVVPFVGILTSLQGISPNPHEVEEIFTVPIGALRDPANRILYQFRHPDGSTSSHPAIAYQEHIIWGLTLRLTTALLRHLFEGGGAAYGKI